MVRKYKRETDRGACPKALDAARHDYKENNMAMKAAAKKHGVDRMTLTRWVERSSDCCECVARQ